METKEYEETQGLQRMKRKFLCIGITLLMGVVIFLIDRFHVPNPTILCMVVVVFAVFFGGCICGILSAGMTLFYSAYFFSDGHNFTQYSGENLYKIGIILLALLAMIITTGMIQNKFLRQTKDLEEMNQLLYQKTISDELSGLYNYRYFLEQLENIWLKCMENQTEISLAMIDIDFFKKYNDYYGHQEGNNCISKVSDILKNNTRCQGGFVARYGGEEFVVVMPDTDAKEAKRIAENFRSLVERSNIEHIKSQLYRYVTISIGVATMIPKKGVTFDTLIKRSDYVLYEVKKAGRNRVFEENDIDTSANIRKTDGKFIFREEQKEAYERLILPVGVFQLVNDKIITLVVSDGLCEMFEVGRLALTEHFDSDMFGNVHPDDVEMLAEVGYRFAREECDYDVTFRTRFHGEEYHNLHVIGKFQNVSEDTRVAFLVYTDLKNFQ